MQRFKSFFHSFCFGANVQLAIAPGREFARFHCHHCQAFVLQTSGKFHEVFDGAREGFCRIWYFKQGLSGTVWQLEAVSRSNRPGLTSEPYTCLEICAHDLQAKSGLHHGSARTCSSSESDQRLLIFEKSIQ